ncbi:hypothetical protein CVS40_12129 [Lucilia cuprina]|nr:hypothetical protein CVS40_12129 [Lucilia cuprina]
MFDRKRKAINKVNSKREKVPYYDYRELYMKKTGAKRQKKTAKRFLKYYANNPNKMNLANIKRPLKTGTSAVLVGPMSAVRIEGIETQAGYAVLQGEPLSIIESFPDLIHVIDYRYRGIQFKNQN